MTRSTFLCTPTRIAGGALLALSCLGSTACQSSAASADCVSFEGLDAQPSARFPSGQTFYLPTPDSARSECSEAQWKLVEGPEGNANEVVSNADGTRFTPHVAGDYRFALGDEVVSVNLGVVDGAEVPFENHNYYPVSALTGVGGEVWVANLYRPTLTRLSGADLSVIAEINVGAWPVAIAWTEGMSEALVAQKGSDTLGVVDVDSGRIVDGIWVGDEPANVLVSPDGATAYVALATSGVIAVVDVATRTVRARIEAVRDPQGMALSSDGATLYVAAHRSGHSDRYPYGTDPADQEQDLVVIDTARGEVLDTWYEVGTTIKSLMLSEDGQTLFLAQADNNTEGALGAEDSLSFIHEIRALSASSGALVASADLRRQASSGGEAVTLTGMGLVGDELWVAAASSGLVVRLDASTLEERGRSEAPGRPRGLLVHDGEVLVHSAQTFELHRFDASGALAQTIATAEDPRTPEVALGQQIFTGAGKDYGVNWSCNNCHADGQGDTLVWNAGPFESRQLTRPIFWQEGTTPIGWDGYMSSSKNSGYEGGATIGLRPNTEQAIALGEYLMSLMPAPAGNDHTLRDGSLSQAARVGKALFEGDATCVGCHGGPAITSLLVLPDGVTPGRTDVPSLVGAYRNGAWLKDGSGRTLAEALGQTLEHVGQSGLSDEQRESLLDYIRELTARDFFLLSASPGAGETRAAIDQPVHLSFSMPVYEDPANLAAIELLDADGAVVPAQVSADGRRVTLTPEAPLAHGSDYSVRLGEALESFSERSLVGVGVGVGVEASGGTIAFTTAQAPAGTLDGGYTWTIQMPQANFEDDGFDLDVLVPVSVPVALSSRSYGASAVIDYGQDLIYEAELVLDGTQLILPPLPVGIGPSFADTTPGVAEVEIDAEGSVTRAAGTLILAGPGFHEDGITWELVRDDLVAECEEGAAGPDLVSVVSEGDAVLISWDGGADALALYVTEPGATLPAGPGTILDGQAYWTLESSDFPTGFVSPVTYGEVPEGADESTETWGGTFEELQAGKCYKVAVTTTAFTTSQVVLRWE